MRYLNDDAVFAAIPAEILERMLGNGQLSTIEVRNRVTGETRTLPIAALFSFIGAVPRTEWLPKEIETDARGFVRTDSVKRVASAVGEGSMAIQFVHEYLKEM